MSDDNIEYNGVERRKYNDMVISVNQRLNDFMERYERDQRVAKEFRIGIEKSIADVSISIISLSSELKEMNRLYKVLIWIITIATGAFLVEAVQWVSNFLKNRITWN